MLHAGPGVTGTANMNVCMVAYGVGKTNGAFVGGHVNNLVTVAKELTGRGHQVDVVTIPPVQSPERGNTTTEFDGVTVYTVRLPSNLNPSSVSEEGNISLVRGALGIPQILKKVFGRNQVADYDVIHGHSGYPWVGLIPELSKVFSSATIVHTLYCSILDRGLPYRTAAALSIGFCDHVVGISENVSESVRNIADVKTSTIPPLVDRKRFSNESVNGCDDTFNLLFVGNLSHSKGIRTLVRALGIVDDELDFRLHLGLDMTVGEYKETDSDVKELVEEQGVTDSIVPVGIVDDLPALMNRCDAFVVPFNDTQGPADYPIAMLEAMSCGLPVVTTPVGGIPEVLTDGKTGLLVEPRDHKALGDQLVELAENASLRECLAARGLEVVDSISANIVDRYVEIYEQ